MTDEPFLLGPVADDLERVARLVWFSWSINGQVVATAMIDDGWVFVSDSVGSPVALKSCR